MNTKASQQVYGGFGPTGLACLSLIIFLSWNLNIAIQQRTTAMEIKRQQAQQMEQAGKVEESLKAIMTDLIDLAKKDPAAAAVLKKYKISMTPPADAKIVSDADKAAEK